MLDQLRALEWPAQRISKYAEHFEVLTMEVIIFIVLSVVQAASYERSRHVVLQCCCLERFAHHVYSRTLMKLTGS
jgi:hypothetical protein